MRFGLSVATAAMFYSIFMPPALAQDDPVIAIVNGTELTRSDLEASYRSLPQQYRQAPLDAIFEPLLERMIDGQLVLEAAKADNLADDPAVVAAIKIASENVLREAAINRAVEAATTDEALQAAYDTRKAAPDFSFEEVHARHILVEEEAEARAIITTLDGGADFAELAAEKSTGPSGPNGGDLGYFKKDAMVPEFGEAAFAMAIGAHSQEPVQTQFGWHVIKVEDKRTSVPSFEETEPQLREEIARDSVAKFLETIRAGAEITRFNADGSARAE